MSISIMRAAFAAEDIFDAIAGASPLADDDMEDMMGDVQKLLTSAIDHARDRFVEAVSGPAPKDESKLDEWDDARDDAARSFDWILRTYRRHGDADAALRLLGEGAAA